MTDKVALITGASRGIGRAIAMELARAGYTVVGTATSEAGAASISEALSSESLPGTGMVLQVTDQQSVDAVLAAIAQDFGPVAVLVNNAGITRDNIMMRMKEEEWMSVIDTNLNALYRLTRGTVRGMTKQRWGRIVNISSVVGAMGNGGQSNYAASKAGMEGFTRALAQEIGSRNITVNCIAPGFIETDMTAELSEAQREAMLSRVPLSRLGQATEIAALAAFLVSDAGAYITGETIHINGGMYMG